MKIINLLFFIFICSTTATIHRLTEKDNNAVLHIDKTDEIHIILKTNPTTGYQWDIQYDSELLTIQKDEIVEEEHPVGMVGYPSSRKIQLLPISTSSSTESTITLYYRRPWEKSKDPSITLTYNIHFN